MCLLRFKHAQLSIINDFFFYSPRRYFLPKRWLISGTRVSQTTFGWITNSGSYQGSLIHKIFAHSWISEVCKHDVEPRGGRFYMYSQRAWFTTLPSASCVKRVRMNLWSPTNPSLNQLFRGVRSSGLDPTPSTHP